MSNIRVLYAIVNKAKTNLNLYHDPQKANFSVTLASYSDTGVPNPRPAEVFQLTRDHFIKLDISIRINKNKNYI